MVKVKLNNNPGSRVLVGGGILQRAKTVKLGAVAGRLKAFSRTHKAFLRLEDAVRRAEAKLQQQQARSGEADAAQDLEVERVAGALVGDGYARKNPFDVMGLPSPSTIKGMERSEEAKVVLKLAATVKKRKDVSAATLAAAARAEKAARAVLAAVAPIAKLADARTKAIAARDALEGEWEYRYASLKLGAKVATTDGDGRVEEALFGTSTAPVKRRAKKTRNGGGGGGTTPQ
jgi:hypothetical protein